MTSNGIFRILVEEWEPTTYWRNAMFALKINDTLELRLLEVRHAEELYQLTVNNRLHLREWLPWVDPIKSAEDTKAFIQSSLQQFANNNGWNCGISYHGKLVGVIGFHSIDWANRKTSIGYWLGAAFEGKGLMTRATRALVQHAFSELKLNRVEIRCAVGNHKSNAIPTRLGFKKEGVVGQAELLYGRYVDHAIYGMVADRWS
jgi:ribosomal-protein-serine acetyltransferase